MNTMLRSSSAPQQTALAPSSLTTTGRTGGGAGIARGVWIGGGLMALTIVALATALVMKSSPESTPQAVATMPAAVSAQATPPATTTTPAIVAPAPAPAPVVAQAPVAEPAPAPAPVHRTVRHTAPSHSTTTTNSTPESSGNTTVASTGTNPAPTATTSPTPAPAPVCTTCGVVDSFEAVQVAGQTNGVGAVAGGVGGAVLGSQIARGHNRTLGGVIGAIGGGLLGNAIEKHERTNTLYDVHVRMNDGSMRTVRQATAPTVGAHVNIEGNTLHAAPQGTAGGTGSGQSVPQGASSYQSGQSGNGASTFSPTGS